METLLSVTALCKSYGMLEVLKDLSFAVTMGEGFAIIGPNGAGKSTLFKSLTGEVRVNAGKVVYDDQDVTELPPHTRTQMGMARTFQVSQVFRESTCLENLIVSIEARDRFFGESAKTAWWDWRPSAPTLVEAHFWLEQMNLTRSTHAPGQKLSHGDRKKLEIAMALISSPKILMLDEPTAGMSITERTESTALLRRLNDELGITLVLTEHDMDVVFGLADRILVMNHGELVTVGAPEAVRADPKVREIYLGQEAHHV